MCDTYKAGDPQKSIGATGFLIIFGIIFGMFLLAASNEKGVTDSIVDKIPKTEEAQARIELMRNDMDRRAVRNR